jgi:hypothetical protein
MRKATALDWTGDPIEVENRFRLGHGERNYKEMLEHFKDYNDIIGDHPLNLQATSLAMNAYMLAGEDKYRRWLLEYVDAWRERMAANNNLIPTNVGLDGKIGSAAGGKWYGGVYGWGFTVKVPQTGALAHRNHHFKASRLHERLPAHRRRSLPGAVAQACRHGQRPAEGDRWQGGVSEHVRRRGLVRLRAEQVFAQRA